MSGITKFSGRQRIPLFFFLLLEKKYPSLYIPAETLNNWLPWFSAVPPNSKDTNHMAQQESSLLNVSVMIYQVGQFNPQAFSFVNLHLNGYSCNALQSKIKTKFLLNLSAVHFMTSIRTSFKLCVYQNPLFSGLGSELSWSVVKISPKSKLPITVQYLQYPVQASPHFCIKHYLGHSTLRFLLWPHSLKISETGHKNITVKISQYLKSVHFIIVIGSNCEHVEVYYVKTLYLTDPFFQIVSCPEPLLH